MNELRTVETELIKAEREKAQAIRAVIHNIMLEYPSARTDKWLLVWHFARQCGINFDWDILDAMRTLPNPDQLMRRRREVISDYYPELHDMADKRLRQVWRKAYYHPASELERF